MTQSSPITRRYLAIFDEVLCSQSASELDVCERADDEKQPHRHFTAFQMECTEAGTVITSAVTPGLHKKEVVKLQEEAAKQAVHLFRPTDVEGRSEEKDAERIITLKREWPQNGGSQYYLDIRSKKDMDNFVKLIANFPDTDQGYKDARRAMLFQGALENIEYKDFVEVEILKEKS